jgi:low affinity Fe/Cu permease
MARRQRTAGRTDTGQESVADRFRHWSDAVTRAVGTPWAMLVAVVIVVVWFVTGPIFGFSDTWQLVINTGTTIVTFLMVFAIQTSQNRESTALHLKIDELIRAHPSARNRLMSEELANEAEIKEDEREMMERADHDDEESRDHRAESSRRRKQAERDRR